MSEYIEKETMRRIIKEQERIHGIRGAGWIELAMDKEKSVDIVRCKECKYWGDEDGIAEKDDFRYARCNVHNHFRHGEHFGWCPKEYDFCSIGELPELRSEDGR